MGGVRQFGGEYRCFPEGTPLWGATADAGGILL